MRYSFRLAKLVGHTPDPRKRPGTIKQICEFTNLDRHQVAALLKNEVKYIPLDAVGKLCDYLLAKRLAKPKDLPGILFALEPENFWELIARRQWVEFCLGVRREGASDTLDDAWVVASDSVMLGELLNGVTTFRMTPQDNFDNPDDFSQFPITDDDEASLASTPTGTGLPGTADAGIAMPALPVQEEEEKKEDTRPLLPEILRQTLVLSPTQNSLDEYITMARNVHEAFWEQEEDDKALIGIGSAKSNPVCERIIANTFGCEPFQSQDDVVSPSKRSVPFFLRYRDRDPSHLTSCCGGWKLAKGQAADKPGIYYEVEEGKWEVCPWDEKRHDAAFVFFVHRPSQGVLEMALGGYSGRASRLLAQHLDRITDECWPPVYTGHGLEVGAFIIRFGLKDRPNRDRTLFGGDESPKIEIIRLNSEVVARRMIPLPDEEESDDDS